jgi:hypothetical protein
MKDSFIFTTSMSIQKEKQQSKTYGKQSRYSYDHPVDPIIGSY